MLKRVSFTPTIYCVVVVLALIMTPPILSQERRGPSRGSSVGAQRQADVFRSGTRNCNPADCPCLSARAIEAHEKQCAMELADYDEKIKRRETEIAEINNYPQMKKSPINPKKDPNILLYLHHKAEHIKNCECIKKVYQDMCSLSAVEFADRSEECGRADGPPYRPYPSDKGPARPGRNPDPLGFPPAYGGELPYPHTDKNTMRPSKAPPSIKFRTLPPRKYFVYQIKQLNVINADERVKGHDKPLSHHAPSAGGCDLITNGSFTTKVPNKPGIFPVVSVMRNGKLENAGLRKTWGRGAVAVLNDGTLIVGRQRPPGPGVKPGEINDQLIGSINEVFSEVGHPVVDFMGGGALLIENGAKVGSDDLYERQHFDNDGRGLSAEQFVGKKDHTLVGVSAGQAFLIIARGMTGSEVQDDLHRAGFGSVVMFDGGGGFYWHDIEDHKVQGSNVLGFCIKTHQE
ncbi:MAG TPA: phosphodiester glycosidase family protein [Blastocatellia bacterium]|nr:phosphodiester glycosidase family protein [Blastocatellia bacterium]